MEKVNLWDADGSVWRRRGGSAFDRHLRRRLGLHRLHRRRRGTRGTGGGGRHEHVTITSSSQPKSARHQVTFVVPHEMNSNPHPGTPVSGNQSGWLPGAEQSKQGGQFRVAAHLRLPIINATRSRTATITINNLQEARMWRQIDANLHDTPWRHDACR